MLVPTREFDLEEMFIDTNQISKISRRKSNPKGNHARNTKKNSNNKSQLKYAKKRVKQQNQRRFFNHVNNHHLKPKHFSVKKVNEDESSQDGITHEFIERFEDKSCDERKKYSCSASFSLESLNEHLSQFEQKMLEYQNYLTEECKRIDEMRVYYKSRLTSPNVHSSNDPFCINAAYNLEYAKKALEGIYGCNDMNVLNNIKNRMGNNDISQMTQPIQLKSLDELCMKKRSDINILPY